MKKITKLFTFLIGVLFLMAIAKTEAQVTFTLATYSSFHGKQVAPITTASPGDTVRVLLQATKGFTKVSAVGLFFYYNSAKFQFIEQNNADSLAGDSIITSTKLPLSWNIGNDTAGFAWSDQTQNGVTLSANATMMSVPFIYLGPGCASLNFDTSNYVLENYQLNPLTGVFHNGQVCQAVTCPTFTNQPTDFSVCDGNDAFFTVEVNNTVGTASYQWQVNTGSGWSNTVDGAPISGSQTSSIDINPATIAYFGTNVPQFQCVVSNTSCTTSSNAVTLTINALPQTTATPPGPVTSETSPVVLTANLGDASSYQWQEGGVDITGATYDTLNVTQSGSYEVFVTDVNTCTGTSNVVFVTLYSPLKVSITPDPSAVCPGGYSQLTAMASDGSGEYAYNWSTGDENAQIIVTPSNTTTYYVTVDDGIVQVMDSVVITVATPPSPTISTTSLTTFCEGQSATLTVDQAYNSYQWYLNGDIQIGATNSAYSVIDSSGDYTCVVFNGSCSGTSNAITITINPAPDIEPNPSAGTITSSTSVLLSASSTINNIQYQWLNGINNIPGATNSSYTADSTGSYTVMITDPLGCTNTATFNVIIGALSISSITATPQIICAGQSTTLNVVAAGGSGNYSYIWGWDATGLAFSQSFSVDTLTMTTQFDVIVDDGVNIVVDSIVVTVNPQPVATTVPTGDTTSTNPVVITASTGNGYTYQWVEGGLAIGGAVSGTYTATATGAYEVVVTNGCGSVTSAPVNVTITSKTLPLSISSITETESTICNGQSSTLNVVAMNGSGNYTYMWSDNTTDQSDVVSPNTTTTYSVTVSDGITSVDTTIVVTVNQLPLVTVSGNPICQGSTGPLTANASGVTYAWSTGATTQSINVGNGNTYTVTVTSSTTGCMNSASGNLTVNSLPVVTVSGNPICQGSTGPLTANASGVTFAWSTGATSQSINVGNGNTYTVTVTSTTTSCMNSASGNVTVNSLPVVSVSGNAICQGATGSLMANASGVTFAWNTGATSQSISVSDGNTYSVTVTSTTTGCMNTASGNLTVNQLPAATITAGGSTSFCEGGSVMLNANAGSGLTYQWQMNGQNLSGQMSASYSAISTGDYTVIVTNGSDCSATSLATTVTVSPSPTATITTPQGTAFCTGGSVDLVANTGSGYTYQWMLNNGNIGGATMSSYTASVAGSYTVVVTSGSCSATSSVVTVTSGGSLGVVIILPNGPTTFFTGGSVGLSVNNPLNGWSYTWFDNNVVIGGANSSTYNATTSGSYYVVVTSGTCTSTSAPETVTVLNTPTSQINNSGDTAYLNGNNGGAEYQWFLNGGLINGATNQDYDATACGTYTVNITVDGVTSMSTPIVVNLSSCCPQVSNLTVTSNTADKVVLTWTPNTTGQTFVVRIAEMGTYNYIYRVTTDNTATFTDLTANTNYRWTVKAFCGFVSGPNDRGITEGYVQNGYFTTTGTSCGKATNLLSSDVAANSAFLTWIGDPSNATAYTIRYWVTPTFIKYRQSSSTAFDMIWLKAATNYVWQVKTFCGSIHNYSDLAYFTTLPGEPNKSILTASNVNTEMLVYPNPSNGVFTLSVSGIQNPSVLSISNVEGQEVYKEAISGNTNEQIDLSNLAKGMYFVRLLNSNNTQIKKIVIE